MQEDKLYMTFKMFDLDGNGKISSDELQKVLGCIVLNFNIFRKR
jgi:Ca2+-binding EF-hand superfamily protein